MNRRCKKCQKDKKESDFSEGFKVCKKCRAIKQKSLDKQKKDQFDLENMFIGTPRY